MAKELRASPGCKRRNNRSLLYMVWGPKASGRRERLTYPSGGRGRLRGPKTQGRKEPSQDGRGQELHIREEPKKPEQLHTLTTPRS